MCWKQGGILGDLTSELINTAGSLNLAERQRIHTIGAKTCERHALEAYLTFVKRERDREGGGTATPADAPPKTTIEHYFAPETPATSPVETSPPPQSAPATKWPQWLFAKHHDSLLHVTDANLRTALIQSHAELYPWLLGDLLRRHPGRGVASDGTFKLLKRTKSDGTVLSMTLSQACLTDAVLPCPRWHAEFRCSWETQVLMLFIGEEHTIVSYYVTEAESWAELEDGCYAFRDRRQRLEQLSEYSDAELCKLKFWVDDKCCMNKCRTSHDRQTPGHAVVDIFDLLREPYKDLFHAINGVTKTCHEGPCDKKALGKQLSKALREVDKDDLQRVMDYLMETRKVSKDVAKAIAYESFCSYGTIRSRAFHRDKQLANLEIVKKHWQDALARATADGQPCIIRKQTKFRQGTIEAIDKLCDHVKHGCLEQPFFDHRKLYLDVSVPAHNIPAHLCAWVTRFCAGGTAHRPSTSALFRRLR